MLLKLTGEKTIMNSFDIDGVITIGLFPGPNDVLITGRSFEESEETYAMLRSKGIKNAVFFNKLPFDKKCRKSSGTHKGKTIIDLIESGNKISAHFEDDEIQKEEIESQLFQHFGPALGGVTVVHIKHDLTEKENVRNPWPEMQNETFNRMVKNGTEM
jgi:hypothetical protein